ncbi:MAG: DUF6542 domain-containing protein [Mycobacteriales bacterium]
MPRRRRSGEERDVYVDQTRDRGAGNRAGYPEPAHGGPTLTGTGAVLLMAGIAGVAGVVDIVAGSALRLVFSAGLVLGAMVAALLVSRHDLLTVVLAPPLVYLVASLVAVLLGRGEGGGDIIDAAASWLVYGFPAMAAATGAAAVIAGIRASRRT